MLRSLYPGADWSQVKIVGFDLDGTLYDEFEFVRQAYQLIAARFAKLCAQPADLINSTMLNRWLEKGSSYNRIFEEQLRRAGVTEPDISRAVEEAVQTFRACKPDLALPVRVVRLLDLLSEGRTFFLVTDGQAELQWAKITSLGLARWFRRENIAVSGEYGPDYRKPSTKLLEKLAVFPQMRQEAPAVYFGDREVDKGFAANAGFTFIEVHCMVTAGGRPAMTAVPRNEP